MEQPRLMTPEQGEQYTGIKARRLRDLLRTGALPGVKLKRFYYLDRLALERLLEQGAAGVTGS